MIDLRDELDASVECGSGFICVMGPPGAGKTTLLLDYLVRREELFDELVAQKGIDAAPQPSEGKVTSSTATARAHHSGAGVSGVLSSTSPATTSDLREKVFALHYLTARSAPRDTLAQFARQLQPATARRRRLSYDCGPLEFSGYVNQWLESHGKGSELHLVVDDADTLEDDVAQINLWLSGCLETAVTECETVCVWLVSQLPLRIADCFRFHFVAPPDVDVVCAWLQRQFAERRELLLQVQEEAELKPERRPSFFSLSVSAATSGVNGECSDWYTLPTTETNQYVVEAIRYYSTHQPMCASVVCRDVRLLLQRVYQLLPALVAGSASASTGAEGGGEACVAQPSKLNAIHFATAWGSFRPQRAETEADRGGSDPLLLALKRIGYSAVLLAFAAFYCGAVPKNKQWQVFGSAEGGTAAAAARAAAAQSGAQSHRASVLSASVHLVTVPRLLFLYESMRRMCVAHIDALEFTTADLAVHYLQGFVAWGLLTPSVSQKTPSYHCWIPVSTALALGRELTLNLFDLIPA